MPSIVPIEVTEHSILSKCDYFSELQIWPLRKKLNPKRWLENFEPGEMEHALYLLNAFIYVSSDLENQLFRSALHSICNDLYADDPEGDIKDKWNTFLSNVLFTNVTGEEPSITDSGIGFARRTKKLLGIPENQILDNRDTLKEMRQRSRPVVFVDDFVGSGNQFKRTWTRKHRFNGERISFKDVATGSLPCDMYYIPLVSTKHGHESILKACPQIRLLPVHVVDERYSVFNLMSKAVWPDHLRPSSLSFIEKASKRAGINTYDPECWMGFHRLGLTIAFEDSIPDATLPLFSWDQNGWHPLIRIV